MTEPTITQADKCLICGQDEFRHTQVLGAGKVCPISATTFRSERVYREAARRDALEEAAKVAEWAHMVPPDGGSPTEDEHAVAKAAAQAIRNLKDTPCTIS